MQVTLNILASDINTTRYLNYRDCAITRALKRAGYPELIDTGIGIHTRGRYVTKWPDASYKDMAEKVQKMYAHKIPIEDFSITLNLDL